jgi:hypothetical protein
MVALIATVVIIAVLLCVMLIPCKGGKSIAAVAARSRLSTTNSKHRAAAGAGGGGVRMGSGVAHGVQLRTASRPPGGGAALPPVLGMMQTSSYDDAGSHMTSESGAMVAAPFQKSTYQTDSGVASPHDIKHINDFLPSTKGALQTKNGPVDPSTGMPLFTAEKLVKSQKLSGHGVGSFLRPEQDPMSGYKRLGKTMFGPQATRVEVERRRAQLKAQGGEILWNTSEFMF